MTTEQLKSSPTDELREFLAIAREHSTASESTVRKDFPCDDAVLVVQSHAGGEVEFLLESYPTTRGPDGEVEDRSLLELRQREAA